jgi:hypothetical protein
MRNKCFNLQISQLLIKSALTCVRLVQRRVDDVDEVAESEVIGVLSLAGDVQTRGGDQLKWENETVWLVVRMIFLIH